MSNHKQLSLPFPVESQCPPLETFVPDGGPAALYTNIPIQFLKQVQQRMRARMKGDTGFYARYRFRGPRVIPGMCHTDGFTLKAYANRFSVYISERYR